MSVHCVIDGCFNSSLTAPYWCIAVALDTWAINNDKVTVNNHLSWCMCREFSCPVSLRFGFIAYKNM